MATIEELIERYQTDEVMREEVAQVIADGKVTMQEFLRLTKKYDVDIPLSDLLKYVDIAKQMGFMK